jgi:hypothetical protein
MKNLILVPIFVILVLVTGCKNENSITSPVDSSTATTTLGKANWQKAAEKQGLNFVKLPETSDQSLSKLVTCTKNITAKSGGTLSLSYKGYGFIGITSVDVSLKILPNAIQQDKSLTISFDGSYMMGDVDLTFGPHGLNFLKPAVLNVTALGLDLSGLPKGTKAAYLWYFNETSGLWEKMNADLVYINVNLGMLVCVNGYLPHFSRYGFTTAPETTGEAES